MGPREILNDYLKSIKGKPFEWGVHDCLTFTNDAFREMYGEGWADDWLGRYMDGKRVLNKRELKAEFGHSVFERAVDLRLRRVHHVPPLGALVTTKRARRWVTGVALGICTGTKAVFLDKVGVLHLPLDDIDAGWIKQ
jgi:hypothetical protein